MTKSKTAVKTTKKTIVKKRTSTTAVELANLKKSVDDMTDAMKSVSDFVDSMNTYIAINTKTSPSVCWKHIMFTLTVAIASTSALQFFLSARMCAFIYIIACIAFTTAFLIMHFSSGSKKL